MASLAHSDHAAPATLQAGSPQLRRWRQNVIAHSVVAVVVMLSGFVIFEPAPYELLMVAVLPIWALFGLRLSLSIAPLIVLLIVFNIGGVISLLVMERLTDGPIYIAVSLFLAFTSIFFAAVIRTKPDLLSTIFLFWTIAATVTSLVGIAGYFHLFPGADLFTRYGRAAGAFEDPNVFGPFLIAPALLLVHRMATRSLAAVPLYAIPLVILAGGVFLSFSRGAWGLFAFCVPLLFLILLIDRPTNRMRLRLLFFAFGGLVAFILGLLLILQIPQIADLFTSRAQLVQSYDGARLGRFARHAIGFLLAAERPLGIGPLVFGKIYGEDTHNIWLKALLDYGWLGFAAYLTLMVWTLAAGFRLLFRDRPWTSYLQIAWIALLGHMLLGTVIDTDHWRHFYLLLGIVWGCIALEARHGDPPVASSAKPSYGPHGSERSAAR